MDAECGLALHFEDLVTPGQARPFEIEHIWANKYDRFTEWYDHPSLFDTERNMLGGLLLLQRGLNQSLGGATYEDKRDAYVSHGQNLLARSLHPLAYNNNPAFAALRERTGLPFRHHDGFSPQDQAERQELYIHLAQWVWNPSRLDLDGIKPPVLEPLDYSDEHIGENGEHQPERQELWLRFWAQLLSLAKEKSDLHSHISPRRNHWLGTRRHGQSWTYVALQEEIRVEMYINTTDAEANKALFDQLYAQKIEVETSFGGPLLWQRLSDKRASRISTTVPGGWLDDTTWAATMEKAVETMTRLYNALFERVIAVRGED